MVSLTRKEHFYFYLKCYNTFQKSVVDIIENFVVVTLDDFDL